MGIGAGGRTLLGVGRGGFGRVIPDNSVLAGLESALVAHYPMRAGLSPAVGSGDLTFARACAATYIDKATGDMVSVSSGVPRYESSGMLIEESRTNEVPYSTNTGAGGWLFSGATSSLNVGEAVPGLSTAQEITLTADTGADYAGVGFTSGAAIGTASCYLYASSATAGKVIDLVIYDATAVSVLGIASFTLSETPMRIEVTGTISTDTNTLVVAAGNLDAFGGSSDLTVGDVFYIDGMQYEAGVGASSLIHTTGASATRLADTLTAPTATLPAYNADHSLAFTIALKTDAAAGHGIYSAEGETLRRAIVDLADAKLYTVHPNANASTNVMAHETPLRVVISYDADGNTVTYVNGSVETTAASAAISGTLTSVILGAYVGGTQPLHGWMRDFKTFNKALSATEALYA